MSARLCLVCSFLLLIHAPIRAQEKPVIDLAFQIDQDGLDVAPGKALEDVLSSNTLIGMHVEPVVQMELEILALFLRDGKIRHIARSEREVRVAPDTDVRLVDGGSTRTLQSPWEALERPLEGFQHSLGGFEKPIFALSPARAMDLRGLTSYVVDDNTVVMVQEQEYPIKEGTSLEGWFGEGDVPRDVVIVLVAPRRDAYGPVEVRPAVIPFAVKEGR